MTEEPAPGMVVCMDLTAETLKMIAGNKGDKCDFCGRGLTVSPDGQHYKAVHGFKLICTGCAQKEAPDMVATPTPHMLGQMAGGGLKGAAAAAMHSAPISKVAKVMEDQQARKNRN